MSCIAIIPARGGSKRLPRKNILEFNGKPMFHYSVEAAEKSGIFDRIVVSTEDPEIIESAAGMGCEVHRRSPHLATDTARVVHVLKDVLAQYLKDGVAYDTFCCLYATSPLRTSRDITGSWDLMREKKADYCMSMTEFEMDPFFAFNAYENGFIERRWKEMADTPPDKRPALLVDNGSIYWAKTAMFMESGELHGQNTVGYEMPRWRSVDIDTLTDFKMAEFFSKEFSDA
ncbi:MAG: acylneuraminate cytidylyltransferase family protein [Desulfobacterales bacterium]|nr:acylneuraminate cytidylyltransferase family protein [Desulfobacterales bacterium]